MPIAKAICNSSCELIGNSQLQLKVVDRRYMVQDMARNVSRKLLIKLVAYKLSVFENMHDKLPEDKGKTGIASELSVVET